MSILSRLSLIVGDIASLIFPPRCAACQKSLRDGEIYLCTACRLDIPLTGFWLKSDNSMSDRVRAFRPEIVEVSAMFFFINKSTWRELIHRIKYKRFWRDGYDMGRWFGVELSRSSLYQDIDVVMAVPLHPMKQLQRGYNQSEFIARGIAQSMELPCDTKTLFRRHHRQSQARSSRDERWQNMTDMFGLRGVNKLNGKHILLVDDVFTTGATTLACAETLLDNIPEVRVSIVALATSMRELGIR